MDKKSVNLSLTERAVSMLDGLAEAYGLSRSATNEMIIRRIYLNDELVQKYSNARKRPKGR